MLKKYFSRVTYHQECFGIRKQTGRLSYPWAAVTRIPNVARFWLQIAPFCRSSPSNHPMGSLTSSAHVCFPPALTAAAVLPDPRSTEGRFVPISARGEQEQESEHVGQRGETWAWWARTVGIVAPVKGIA